MASMKYVGLDVHKESIAVAVADEGPTEVRFHGTIGATTEALRKLVRRLGSPETLRFAYEAGPCGYGVYRTLTDLGAGCAVVAPSLIPQRAGDRVKTDRRDACGLARLHRAGELTAVWVPDAGQEAMRDLTRAREDARLVETRARQRLGSFLLRHDMRLPDGRVGRQPTLRGWRPSAFRTRRNTSCWKNIAKPWRTRPRAWLG